MEPEFITFQKFNDPALANELTAILDEHHIEYYVQQDTSGFDPSLVMSNAIVDHAVKIKPEDFERVNQLLSQNEERYVDEIDKDYYLFAFTNDELMEVITKGDEWSAFDVLLARKLLKERGVDINDNVISEIQEKRIEELKKPEESQSTWIIIGYVFAFLAGILGIFIGWYLATGKKNLPNGERVYIYSDNDRRQGRIIFYISVVCFVLSVILRFYKAFSQL